MGGPERLAFDAISDGFILFSRAANLNDHLEGNCWVMLRATLYGQIMGSRETGRDSLFHHLSHVIGQETWYVDETRPTVTNAMLRFHIIFGFPVNSAACMQ